MSADVGIRFPVWDLSKSQYEETDFLPLMSTPGPVMVILAVYLLYVLKIGPALMVKREPYKLTTVLLLYNAIQVAYSIYLVQKYFRHLLQHGLVPKTCFINQESERNEILFSIWLYFAAKVSELLDTVFFVLRKKDNQITFLHLYHHSIMMIGTWAYLKYWPSDTLFFIGFLNSLVHVFMYTYYGLSALGPRVAKYIFWKKYMTKFQLVQFVCIIIHYIAAVRNSECPPSSGVATFIGTNTAFFLILFLHFYRQSYNRRKNISNENVSATKCNKEL
ncbi:elongation of very long chain fatty acids protein-like [Vanessa atalanta]|uniref:elongation of very long chain fatty acids protein-like n=1 Tax=Vanessa atalanta TaxID=42275 RepID=UPI001FCCFD30|nr:elongation of very long chain fatty acids protein-like [Vanessa atalanta]XP_047527056.1 elongation of very long chain fatty acids protein-like [Vanessa atalanta]